MIFWLGQMAWYEPAYNAVEFVMLGVVQIVVIALGMRFFERRWPLEKTGDDRLIGVDRVYTVLNKLGIVPFAIFVITYPISQEIELLMRSWGMAPPRLERLLPWLGDNVLASFLVYFVLYDFAAYWLHRAQHAIPWWWALHSLHHSQRRMTVWSDDRNHVLDDFLITLALVLFSQMVGVQPGEYVIDPHGRPPDRELEPRQRRHELRQDRRAADRGPALPPPAPCAGQSRRAPYPRPQFRAGVPDLGHPVRHGDLRRQAPSDGRRRSPWSTPTTAAAGSSSR